MHSAISGYGRTIDNCSDLIVIEVSNRFSLSAIVIVSLRKTDGRFRTWLVPSALETFGAGGGRALRRGN
jgi:hypothetical protein